MFTLLAYFIFDVIHAFWIGVVDKIRSGGRRPKEAPKMEL
jgi:hypothetical protein